MYSASSNVCGYTLHVGGGGHVVHDCSFCWAGVWRWWGRLNVKGRERTVGVDTSGCSLRTVGV